MANYAFQAKQLDGRIVRGELEAANESEARVKIRAQQMIPLKVVLGVAGSTPTASLTAKKPSGVFSIGGGVKSKELQIFTRQFATLINAGIPVVQGLEMLEKGVSNLNFRTVIAKIRTDISQGKKLADALAEHPKVFDRLYVNLVKAGEEGGVLDTVLNRLAVYIEKAVKIKGKVMGAMYYPAGVLAVAGLVLFAILHFVIPKFEELFKSSGQELPLPTVIVIEMSHFMQSYWYIPLITMVVGFFAFKSYYATPDGKRTIDYLLLSSPIFGSMLQKSAIARFSRTLSTLLSCGVGILDALEISARVAGNAIMEATLLNAKKTIAEGKSIVHPLSKDKYIPDMVVQMIGVGEQTGAMDTMLAKIADFYEEEVDTAVAGLMSLIEPIMMVFLGGMIGGVVIAMYLPIFNLASGVK